MKLNLSIECDSIAELQQILGKMNGDVQPTTTGTVDLKSAKAAEMNEINKEQPVAEEASEQPQPRRSRRTKAERQQALKEVVAEEPVNVPNEDEVDPADESEDTHVYSYTEFSISFPKIISSLIEQGELTHQNLDDYCKMYEVKNILGLVKQPQKLQAFYKQLSSDKVIKERGDY